MKVGKVFICNICSSRFTQKHSLNTHLNDNRCKSADLLNINNAMHQQNIELKEKEQLLIEKEKEILELKQKEQEILELKQKEEIDEEIDVIPEQQLVFHGIFQGRENEIRITPDKMVSVYDFIKVVGGQTNPRKTWGDILKFHKDEVVTFCYNLKFPGAGQKLTPVVNVQGVVQILFWLPGETAKQFRSKSAEQEFV